MRYLQIIFSLLLFAFFMLFFSPWYWVKGIDTEFTYTASSEVKIALACDYKGNFFSREKLFYTYSLLPEAAEEKRVKIFIPSTASNICGVHVEVLEGKDLTVSNFFVSGRRRSHCADWKKDLVAPEGLKIDGEKLTFGNAAAIAFPHRIKCVRKIKYGIFSVALLISLAAAAVFFLRIKTVPSKQLVFISAAMVIMLFPVVHLDISTVVSDENRFLQKFPEFTKKFPKEFESYLGDRFFCRSKMIKLNRKIFDFNLFSNGNLSGNQKAFYGKDGWIFSRGFDSVAMAQNHNRFTEEELQECARRLNELADKFSAEFNAKVFVVLMPDKERVYEEYYPDFLLKQRTHKQSRLEQLTDYLRKNSKVVLIAPLPQLLENKKSHQLYYMGGTHQTPRGAYIAAAEIKKAIRREFPQLKNVPENIRGWKPARNGDVDAAMQLGFQNPEKELDSKYLIADEAQFICRSTLRKMYEIPHISLLTMHFVSDDKSYQGLRILTVGDSFWGHISSFMVPLAAEEIYAFFGSGKDFVFEPFEEQIKEFKPQVVIIESTERFLHRFLTLKYGK